MRAVPLTRRGAFCRLLNDWAAEHGVFADYMPSPVEATRPEWLYFATSWPDQLIKVGWSLNPLARMVSLSDWYGRDYQLAAVVHLCGRDVEYATLRLLGDFQKRHHNRRETFDLNSPVAELVALTRAAATACFFDNRLARLRGPIKHCRFCDGAGHNAQTCTTPIAAAWRNRDYREFDRLRKEAA